jgi:type VI secretion system protein ImpF
MPRADEVYLPSLLDRLSGVGQDGDGRPFLQKKEEWRSTLLSEVELLLNTKRASTEIPEEYRYASESILVYGIRDCTGMTFNDEASRAILRNAIERALRIFEPRLNGIRVSVELSVKEPSTREPPTKKDPSLRFIVEAVTRAQLGTEPIRFTTVLEPAQSRFLVRS